MIAWGLSLISNRNPDFDEYVGEILNLKLLNTDAALGLFLRIRRIPYGLSSVVSGPRPAEKRKNPSTRHHTPTETIDGNPI